jgi:putative Ca2+/H+ antiporter (TMEM165/GDT1 family)
VEPSPSLPSLFSLQLEDDSFRHSTLAVGLETAAIADGSIDPALPDAPVANAIATTDPQTPDRAKRWQFWKLFGSTFITIFLAELGDKTQVTILLFSAEFHAPWVVFAGAAAALITTSLLGVLVGRWLSTRLSPKTLDLAAGITLALISVGLFLDVLTM